jgi:hypothetical protein
MAFRDMRATVGRPQHFGAVEGAAVQNHLGEFQVVADRRVKIAAAHVEFRVLGDLHAGRHHPVLGPGMDLGEALSL